MAATASRTREILTRLAVPALGDYFSLVLGPTGTGRHPLLRALPSGGPTVVDEVDDAWLRRLAGAPEELKRLRGLGLRSLLLVPVVARGALVGAIAIGRRAGRPSTYSTDDVARAEDLAVLAAQMAENARLVEENELATSLRDEFLGLAAHELRTPLTSLRGHAQLVLKQLRDQGEVDPERLRRALQVVERQSARLGALVTRLVDLGRIDSHTLTLERSRGDLGALVADAVARLRAHYPNHDIVARSASGVPVSMDATLLEQVIGYLVDNAAKFSPTGTRIVVEARTDGDDGVLTVRDHGLGMAPEALPRVFDRFYQAHGERHYGGMGLGLYIAREVVALHGGTIRAEGPPDGGTRIVVRLPLAAEVRGAVCA